MRGGDRPWERGGGAPELVVTNRWSSEGFTPAARAKGLASLAKRKSSIAGKSDDVFGRLLFVRVHRVAPEHQPWRRETRFSGPPFLISGIITWCTLRLLFGRVASISICFGIYFEGCAGSLPIDHPPCPNCPKGWQEDVAWMTENRERRLSLAGALDVTPMP